MTFHFEGQGNIPPWYDHIQPECLCDTRPLYNELIYNNMYWKKHVSRTDDFVNERTDLASNKNQIF